MRIASSEVSIDEARARVEKYAANHPKTLEIFDGVGEGGHSDESPNQVTLADIGRLVVVNAQLQADDVPALLEVDAHDEFAAVPVDAALEECTYNDETWKAATVLFNRFLEVPGIARAKRSKLLHAKRPRMFFISDSKTAKAYESVAAAIAAERDDDSLGYWEAAQRDITQPEFESLMSDVARITVPGLSGEPNLGSLTRLRVLDIVCWTD
jgi:hypothetical protein